MPLLYSIHTDGSKLPGGVPSLASASQACTAYLSAACATTSPSFARILADRGVIRAAKNVWTYRPPTSSDLRIDLSTAEIAEERRRLTNGEGATVLLLYAGRWSAEKRIGLLVRCVRQLPDVSLSLIGDAADESIAREIQQWHDPHKGVHVVRGMRRRGRELACSYAAADFLARRRVRWKSRRWRRERDDDVEGPPVAATADASRPRRRRLLILKRSGTLVLRRRPSARRPWSSAGRGLSTRSRRLRAGLHLVEKIRRRKILQPCTVRTGARYWITPPTTPLRWFRRRLEHWSRCGATPSELGGQLSTRS